MPPSINLILRIQKLERLARNNSNPHEAAAAQLKADALRAKLPKDKQPKPAHKRTIDNFEWLARKAPRMRPASKNKWEFLIEELQLCMHKLKPSGQVFAADLASQFYAKGRLTEKQWACVNQLIIEADLPYRKFTERGNKF